jgi:hypothetical protein
LIAFLGRYTACLRKSAIHNCENMEGDDLRAA